MASPPSEAEETTTTKVSKDRNCPFCGQAFTSSSLGRHLDLYIKPKNPKPPDGIHDVGEIRKIRGNITRRQSRAASARRDATATNPTATANHAASATSTTTTPMTNTTPNLPVAATFSHERKQAPSSVPATLFVGAQRRTGGVNRPGWEATGVMNDLPPRVEVQPEERWGPMPKEELKQELNERQRLIQELDKGRAAQLALQEVLEQVRNAEASHSLFNFDFFSASFASLCIQILSLQPPLNAAGPIMSAESWALNVPWEAQRDDIMHEIDERATFLNRGTQVDSAAVGILANIDRYKKHVFHAFELWRSLADSLRRDIWQREMLHAYLRNKQELKDAQNTIVSLKREVEHLSRQLDRSHGSYSGFSNSFQNRYHSPYAPLTSIRISDEVLRDVCKQGLNLRDWDYDRLLDKWLPHVKDERRAHTGLGAQSLSSIAQLQADHAHATLLAYARPASTASRSGSVASAGSHASPARNTSTGPESLEVDAEGEEDEDANAMRDGPQPPSPKRHAHAQAIRRLTDSMHPSRTTRASPVRGRNSWSRYRQAGPDGSTRPSVGERIPPTATATTTATGTTAAWSPDLGYPAARRDAMEGIEGPAVMGAARSGA